MTAWDWILKTLEFFFVTILLKYIVAHWVAERLTKLFKRLVIKTKEQAILWIHYRDRAMGHGHDRDPDVCLDGSCQDINLNNVN